jgi:hypothetical protein
LKEEEEEEYEADDENGNEKEGRKEGRLADLGKNTKREHVPHPHQQLRSMSCQIIVNILSLSIPCHAMSLQITWERRIL